MATATAFWHTGETPVLQVNLLDDDGTVYPITSGWTVQVGLKRRINGRMKLVAGPWTVSEATTGSDWLNGIIQVEAPAADTAPLWDRRYDLEVLVEYSAGKDKRWTVEDVRLIKGVLPLSS